MQPMPKSAPRAPCPALAAGRSPRPPLVRRPARRPEASKDRELMAPTLHTRRKRSDDVAEEIERLIRSGAFRIGDRLPSEADLSRQLGVGRPSVREALFMLQHRGLVDTSNGARAKVMAPTADFLVGRMSDVVMSLHNLPEGQMHLEQTRLIFESGLAWLAAQNAAPEDIARMNAALAANVAAVGDTPEFVRTDVAFHYEIARTARNPIFEAFHRVLVEWLIDQRTTTINLPDADRLSARDHAAVFEAIAAGDPARAYHEMASHLRLISRLYREATHIQQTVLRKATRDVAARAEEENAEIWRASFRPDGGGSGT
jgi:GntR family transcriptional repressor for pyruvate dehydrogenase complex